MVNPAWMVDSLLMAWVVTTFNVFIHRLEIIKNSVEILYICSFDGLIESSIIMFFTRLKK